MPILGEAAFNDISGLMYESIGLAFSPAKMSLVASRLGPRIAKLGLDGFEAYFDLIANADDRGEFQVAIDLLTTNETYFFREAQHFDHLERHLTASHLPAISIWSAASSFGDEAYSIAMALADLQTVGRVTPQWRVLGTDISDRVLRSAVAGIYPAERLRQVTPERLRRYCLRGEGEAQGLVRIGDGLRERVSFGRLNLTEVPADVGRFDAIFLRNVLIYFDAETKRDVVDRVLANLRPGGLFFIGTAEARLQCRTRVQPLAPGVFKRLH